ncbi:MAG: nitrous oxidase accessory protein [Marinoscillum sp.]|jgi:nitrous oxidase accessory protein
MGATIRVCEQCEVKTIEGALLQAGRGDSVVVAAGIYECKAINITRPVSLIGEKGAVLDGGGINYAVKILCDSVTLSGFTVQNTGRSYTKDYAAIYTYRASHFTISNNEIIRAFFGILLEKSSDGVVSNNRVVGVAKREDESGNGIHLWHCQNTLLIDNEVTGMRDGIYLEFVDGSTVAQNHTHHNVRYGLHFMFSNHDEYRNNTFEDNGAGVAVMFSKWIVMKENRFINNWGTASYGLLLKEIYDGEVTGNLFESNTMGIFIDGSTRINYSGNVFKQNGWALKVSGGCYANHFFKNNFISNSFDLSYNTKVNDNSFEGNFWSDYNGYDLDKDGKGDVPYRPVKLFSYIVNKTPETIVLLRSLFVDIINFAEKVSPVFTPDDLVDSSPSMHAFQ